MNKHLLALIFTLALVTTASAERLRVGRPLAGGHAVHADVVAHPAVDRAAVRPGAVRNDAGAVRRVGGATPLRGPRGRFR